MEAGNCHAFFARSRGASSPSGPAAYNQNSSRSSAVKAHSQGIVDEVPSLAYGGVLYLHPQHALEQNAAESSRDGHPP